MNAAVQRIKKQTPTRQAYSPSSGHSTPRSSRFVEDFSHLSLSSNTKSEEGPHSPEQASSPPHGLAIYCGGCGNIFHLTSPAVHKDDDVTDWVREIGCLSSF
jgi:hypothetical protein